MWILPFVGYLGLALGFGFLTLAIGEMSSAEAQTLFFLPPRALRALTQASATASGLYYLSELVEEHTVLAKKLLTRLIYLILAIQTLLWLIDGFPFMLSLLGCISHAVYAANLRKFPFVRLTDGVFISSCILVLINHYLCFRHFSAPRSRPPNYYRSGSPVSYTRDDVPTFTEVAAFFGICIWLVPFALFVSLSAGDNVLPSMGSEMATGGGAGIGSAGMGMGREKNKGLAKAVVDGVREWASETGELMGFWRGERTRV